MNKNIVVLALTILALTSASPVNEVVDLSILREAQRELGIK